MTVADPAPVAPAVAVPSPAALPAVTTVSTGLSRFDAQVLDNLNAQRAAASIPPLAEARGLDSISAQWSTDMANGKTAGLLAHNPQAWQSMLTSGAAARTNFGENVASWWDPTVTPASVVAGYLANSSNAQNVLDPQLGFVGIGTATTAAGTRYQTLTFSDAVDPGQAWDPALRHLPSGQLESATLRGSIVTVAGWGADPDPTADPLQVKLTDTAPDGSVTSTVTPAGTDRPDMTQQYPDAGAAKGFAVDLPIAGRGRHQLCATVLNAGAGAINTALGCMAVDVTGPFGKLDSGTLSGSTVTLAGWAVDPDVPGAAVTVAVTDDGPRGLTTLSPITAGATNVNVDAAIPGVGPAHGFTAAYPLTAVGTHTICATAKSMHTPLLTFALGCQTVTIAPAAGAVTAVSNTTSSVTIGGWAIDPQALQTGTRVTATLTNPQGLTSAATVDANLPATGSVARFPDGGAAHGFQISMPTTVFGNYRVCVGAASVVDPTSSTDLGCQSVMVSNVLGWFDSVVNATGGLYLRGWAFDPALPTTTGTVTISVTGPSGTRIQQAAADQSRPDVGRAYPGAGDYHGLRTTVPAMGSGTNKVCLSMKSLVSETVREYRCLSLQVP